MTERFYVTTPIYYVNDKPHIGHAYCTILADAARRWRTLLGEDAYFVTGTDEHGQKVQQAAEKRGVAPQQHCDELYRAFKDLWPTLHCAPDQFIRTTEPRHKAVVRKALQQLYEEGLIVPREFEGWYCTADERFWTEKELKDGNCPDCGRIVVRLKEKNWFFLMSRYQQPLIDAIQSGRMEIVPAGRANEVLGFLQQPLQDLCISRPKSRLSWGIELPFDQDYVCYVWFDALLNYVTAVGGLGAEPPTPPDLPPPATHDPPRDDGTWDGDTAFAQWWPAVTHFLGKDILTTHAVYWPTMLMAMGLPVPRRLVVTGWWLTDNTKMSKSLGNVVDPLSLKDKYGPEVLRYFLLREMAVGQDSNFSEEALVRRNNADLANDLGNLVQRVIALCVKWFDGQVPEPPAHRQHSAALDGALNFARLLLGRATGDFGDVRPIIESVRDFRIHRTLADVMLLVSRLNQVLTADAPFHTVRTDKEAAALTLYSVLDGIRIAANLLEPVLPATSLEILRRIGWHGDVLTLDALDIGQLRPGVAVIEGAPLFPKHVVEQPEPEIARTGELPALRESSVNKPELSKPEVATVPQGPTIDIDTFAQAELRVGRVLQVDAVPKSHKLLKLLIDLGEGTPRQILSGIAETVAPADLLGRQVLVIANLPPRKLMGHDSHGMLLVAEDAEGKRVPLHPGRDVPNGSGVK